VAEVLVLLCHLVSSEEEGTLTQMNVPGMMPMRVPKKKSLKGTERSGEARLMNQLGRRGEMRRNKK
jgi:hypothetical protein